MFSNIVGSRLFWIAVVFIAIGVVIGVVSGRKVRSAFEATPGSTISLLAGFFFLACIVLGTLRGSIINNLWWVITVTLLSTALGLAVAVLADRAKGENIAKSLIFLPMAISFVGAGVIWTLIYKPRNINEPQSGLLNAIWYGLGQLSNSSVQKWIVFIVLAAIVGGLLALAWTGCAVTAVQPDRLLTRDRRRARSSSRSCSSRGGSGSRSSTIVRCRTSSRRSPTSCASQPFNNMWLMVVLIWIQTGFAMVIFSSAIKAVPTEFLEAASIDGATPSQTFWRVTLPQLLPTVGVVVTTLIVAVMKVYDVIQVMTGGQSGTQVIAFQMIEQINIPNFGTAVDVRDAAVRGDLAGDDLQHPQHAEGEVT